MNKIKIMVKTALLLVVLLFLSRFGSAQCVAPFHKGDRVVFVGNSITDGGHYHSYIWLYYMTHFPNSRIDVFNAGIGGDIAGQMLDRLNTDVFSRKPTVITLTFGMNDTGYMEFLKPDADQVAKQKIQISCNSFLQIEKRLKEYPNVRKIMIGTSPYDETSKIKYIAFPKKNEAMLEIVKFQQQHAIENKWDFIDFNHPMVAINLKGQKKDSLFTLGGTDRVHPLLDGHLVMAYLFLKAQGLANKKVADIEINAAQNKLLNSANCRISNLVTTSNSVTFNYLANSLPYPLDTTAINGNYGPNAKRQTDALTVIPFIDEFNQELLKIKGLKEGGHYSIEIDKKLIGTWTGATLASGINLALISSTPQYQQALAIMYLNEERWAIERRLREYAWIHYSILTKKGLLFNDNESTYDSLKLYAKKDFYIRATLGTYQKARFASVREAWQMEMNTLVNEIYKINKPVEHSIKIELMK
jgi:lysophospholipase L1-like esterase